MDPSTDKDIKAALDALLAATKPPQRKILPDSAEGQALLRLDDLVAAWAVFQTTLEGKRQEREVADAQRAEALQTSMKWATWMMAAFTIVIAAANVWMACKAH